MNNKPRQIQINNEDEDNISMTSSPEENTKEPTMTPRRTTTPKRQHSISRPLLYTDVEYLVPDNTALSQLIENIQKLQSLTAEHCDILKKY